MSFVQTNGITLYYELHGSGAPLVLIPGLGYDGWMWHRMIPGLAQHFEVISIDNRGCGQNDVPPGAYTAQMLAADVAGMLDAFDLPRAHIMGHSMGGFIAQALAIDYPERLDKLILSATNFGGPRHVPITAEAMAVLTDVSGDPVERLRRGIRVSCAAGFTEANPAFVEYWIDFRVHHPINPAGYQSQLAIGLSLLPEAAAFEGRLSAVEAPTLILFGEQDRVVPSANAALLAGAIPHSRIELLPDAGHFFPFEVPEAANAAVIRFLTAE
ncbi:MAG: alpha/beta fold hydrolase [Candidatus Promineofilum sp.]|nr:alpha/beta fold hydrolase [Promineifilum sp.]